MKKAIVVVVLIVANPLLVGCSHFVSKAADSFGNNQTGAILNQDDPALVRAGMPSYILLLDSFLQGEEDNPAILSAAATMYASYGSVFADDPARAKRLTRRAREYPGQAMCMTLAASCNWRGLPYDAFVASLQQVNSKQADQLYAYGFAFLAAMELGYLTPPVGLNLFISSYRFEKPIMHVYSATFSFLMILLISVILITFWPSLSLCLVPAS
ncbi:MAG: TRAP transporter TatT component family protein [Proteobacteria bacterium]|nr:TRAP transporter TatT component family protein [Pseudomonadota bacterium]